MIVSELILQAFNLAQVTDPNEELQGFMADDGLMALNSIIAQWGALSIYIPTYTIQSISLVAADYQYTVTPPIAQLLEANIIDSNNVQTTLFNIDLKKQNTLNYAFSATEQSRPSYVFLQNDASVLGVSTNVFFYPVPDQAYTASLKVKKNLVEFTYSEEIVQIPAFYLKPLRYQLAKDISDIYGSVLSQTFLPEYERIITELKATVKKDMTINCQNPFRGQRQFRPWGTFSG